MRRLYRIGLFARACAIALWARLRSEGLRPALAQTLRVLAFLVDPVTAARAALGMALHRLRRCRACSLFNRRYGTCGTWRVTLDRSGSQLGCLCFMPFKVFYAAATCWLADRTEGRMGWT